MEWIKCSDRLPEIDKKVLALIENRRCICEWGGEEWYDDYFIDTPNEKFFDSYFDIKKYINDKITHWLPLPNPPKDC